MPYRTISELPKTVRVLPIEAQRIFLKVVNAALERYPDDEEKCFKIAWAAVKRAYRKTDDRWVKKKASLNFKYSAQISPTYIYPDDGKHYARIYLIDTTVNEATPRWQVTDEALERALNSIIGKPLIAYPDHSGRSPGVGVFENVIKEDGFAVGLARIIDPDAWEKIRSREWRSVSPSVNAFSVAHSDGVEIIDDFAFDHIAFVPHPAYSRAKVLETFEGQEGGLRSFSVALTQKLWEVQRREDEMSEYAAGVIPFVESRKAPEDMDWNFRAADYDVDQLKRACTWYDSENPDVKGSYKLPHHLPDGRVVWRGVSAAMQVLLGARGGVDIPAGDRKSAFSHLRRHYKQFDKEPPEYHGQKKSSDKPRSAGSETEGKNMEEDLEKYKADLAEAKKVAEEYDKRIADLEAENTRLKTDLDKIMQERHGERVNRLVDLRLKAGLGTDRNAEIKRVEDYSDDVFDRLIEDTEIFVAHMPEATGPKTKYTAEQRLDAVEKVRKDLYGYTRDAEGKIVGGT